MPILLLLGGGINQARVRRRIFRLKILDRFKVGRVGHDFGELLQLFELVQLRFFILGDSSAHNRSSILLIGCSVTLLGLSPKRTPRSKDRQSEIYFFAASPLSSTKMKCIGLSPMFSAAWVNGSRK